jgi:Spondin_N
VKNIYQLLALSGVILTLQACDSDNDNFIVIQPPPPPPPAMASFDVTVVNLTNAQPLSPIAVIGHAAGYTVFSVGAAATTGLEELAEGGDNTALIAAADADMANVFVTGSGAAPIGPAGSDTVSITLLASDVTNLKISAATMLVNTNDAFSALNGFDVSAMMVGDSMMLNSIAYDAGTEADTEAAVDIPGPAGGGEGFNAMRNDAANRVAMHSGVTSRDDGFASSDLTEQHRFDNPVMRVRIERMQ